MHNALSSRMVNKTKALLEVKDITFSYKNSKSNQLRNISFSVNEGELVAVLGKSGAGKSTLLLTLNGLIPLFINGSFCGNVLLEGKDISSGSIPESSKSIGIVFQDFESQLFSTSVDLEVAFGLENLGVDREKMKEAIPRYLEMTGLEGFQSRQPSSLSGGEKQRLAIAAALAMEPLVICLDEPTTDLDPEGKESVFAVMKQLKNNKKRIIVAVEHETDELINADRCIVIDNGEIVCEGSGEKILIKTEMLEKHGILPPQLAVIAKIAGSDKPFKDAGEAVRFINEKGYKIDEKAVSAIKEEEEDFFRKIQNSEKEIEIENVIFSYEDGNDILKDISLEFRRGEITAIAGSNGSGKTTLVKHFNGLLKPKSGSIRLGRRDINEYSSLELVQRAGFVFQNPDCQIFSETVRDEAAFTPRLLGLDNEKIESRVKDSLDAVGLADYADYDPFVLTKGERQRIAVASVLAARSDIIILDEPTTGLDFNELKGMMNLLLTLNRNGHTIIMVTHSMHIITNYAKRLIIMKNGKTFFDGKTADALTDEKLLSDNNMKMPAVAKISSMLDCRLKTLEEFEKVVKIDRQ